MRPGMQKLTGWVRRLDFHILLAVLVLAGGGLLFLVIADAVRDAKTQSLDEAILRSLRRPDDPQKLIGPPWMGEVARDLTALGGVAVLGLVTVGVAGYLALVRAYGALCLVLAATLGALLLSSLLKHAVHRPRPELVPHLSSVYTSSFPSGHSMLSSAVYLTLGALLARLTRRTWLKVYFVGGALLVTFLVGCSRVYMGVHYPTDVLAGWCVGLSWALLCWLVAGYLQRHRAVERSAAEPDTCGEETTDTSPTR
jgi:undecaprenyl-diphosphatase